MSKRFPKPGSRSAGRHGIGFARPGQIRRQRGEKLPWENGPVPARGLSRSKAGPPRISPHQSNAFHCALPESPRIRRLSPRLAISWLFPCPQGPLSSGRAAHKSLIVPQSKRFPTETPSGKRPSPNSGHRRPVPFSWSMGCSRSACAENTLPREVDEPDRFLLLSIHSGRIRIERLWPGRHLAIAAPESLPGPPRPGPSDLDAWVISDENAGDVAWGRVLGRRLRRHAWGDTSTLTERVWVRPPMTTPLTGVTSP